MNTARRTLRGHLVVLLLALLGGQVWCQDFSCDPPDSQPFTLFSASADKLPNTPTQSWTSRLLRAMDYNADGSATIRIVFTATNSGQYLAANKGGFPKIALAELQIIDANNQVVDFTTSNYSQYFTFYITDPGPNRGGDSCLFDGDTSGENNTWHSLCEDNWNANLDNRHLNTCPYIEISLPASIDGQSYDYSSFRIKYWTRNKSGAANPQGFYVTNALPRDIIVTPEYTSCSNLTLTASLPFGDTGVPITYSYKQGENTVTNPYTEPLSRTNNSTITFTATGYNKTSYTPASTPSPTFDYSCPEALTIRVKAGDQLIYTPNNTDPRDANCTTAVVHGSLSYPITASDNNVYLRVYARTLLDEADNTLARYCSGVTTVLHILPQITIDYPTTPADARQATVTITKQQSTNRLAFYTTDGSLPTSASNRIGQNTAEATFSATSAQRVTALELYDGMNSIPNTNHIAYSTADVAQAPAPHCDGDSLRWPAGYTLYYTTSSTDDPLTGTAVSSGTSLALTGSIRACCWNTGQCIASPTVSFSAPTPINSLADITDPYGHYLLTTDITAAGAPSLPSPFHGTLDGGRHTVSGLTAPLFSTLDGATLCNLYLTGAQISDPGASVGSLAREATGESRIYNCGLLKGDTSFVDGGERVGSLVGTLSGRARVVNCFSFANIGGQYAGGIVGWNEGTTPTISAKTTYLNTIVNTRRANDVTTIVSNCMFYGNAAGSLASSPAYCGQLLNNKYLPVYNFYHHGRFQPPAGVDTAYNGALPAEEMYLTHIETFRLALNTNRELCAWYLFGDRNATDGIDKWVLDKSAAPYPILRPWGYYPSLVNLNPATYAASPESIAVASVDFANLQDTTGKYRGQTLGVLKVNVRSGSGGLAPHTEAEEGTRVIYLPITDMDTLNHDFNYYKAQLPYYNDLWSDNYLSAQEDGYGRVVTGWKILSAVGDPAISYHDFDTTAKHPTHQTYNFADRLCLNKDLYGKSQRVFAQGGYYNVPEGVTEITIQAYWGRAVYLNQGPEMVYLPKNPTFNIDTDWVNDDSIYYSLPFALAGSQTSDKTPLFADYNAALTALPPAGTFDRYGHGQNTVYDNAIVLVGNYSSNRYHIHIADHPTGDVPVTITSVDLDNDREPDFGLAFYWNTRNALHPIRFDFVNNPSFGALKKPADHKADLPLGIPHPRGHFEITETSNGFYNQNEYADCANDGETDCRRLAYAPMILNGGSTNMVNATRYNTYTRTIEYIILGGNFHATLWTPGMHFSGTSRPTYHAPTSILGAEIDEYYNTGRGAGASNMAEPAHLYANGGRIGTYAGAFLEQLNGDVYNHLDHLVVDTFYGGGTSASKPIKGSISNNLTNCIVRYYCGGPKFGDIQQGKSLTNRAEGCVFGTFFGAGYGGTALSGRWLVNISDEKKPGQRSLIFNDSWVTSHYGAAYAADNDDRRLGYNQSNGGYRVSYHFDWFTYSWAYATSSVWGIFYNATLSVAQVNSVTSELNDCWVRGDFYGGGSLGRVKGDATSTLTRCRVDGDAYGGGYSATVPPVYVYDATGYAKPSYNPRTGKFSTFGYPQAQRFEWRQSTTVPGVDEANRTLNVNVDFSTLGSVAGSTRITIDGTEVRGSVFGGGNESPVNQNTSVLIKGASFVHRNVYGGGNEGEVRGNTEVVIGE